MIPKASARPRAAHPSRTLSRPAQVAPQEGPPMNANTIIWTYTDEAPMLATYSFLPIVTTF
ncbi:MAG: NADP-dependent isocitrate dehydrogenase, partial [Bacteroidia bacterium]|nr:NADP-dependent isocitrate dehydrogenase [Bacteroidia bacterium]